MEENNNENDTEIFAKIISDFKMPIIHQIDALKSFLDTSCLKMNEEEKELIELTLNSCKIMHNFADIFLMVYKNAFENNNLEYEKFDFIAVLNEIVEDYTMLIKYYNLELELKTPETLKVYADKTKIKKILENLILNNIDTAFKNTKIIIEVLNKDTEIEFKIKSKSKHVKQNVINEIFTKNKKQNSLYQKPSKGLGLYVTNEVIKAHLGKTFAKSYTNDTNVFGFSIPTK